MAEAPILPFGPLHFLLQEAVGRDRDFSRLVPELYDLGLQQFREVRCELPADATASVYLANTIVGTTRAWVDRHHADRLDAFDRLWAEYGGAANCALLLRAMRAEDLLLRELAADRAQK